MSVSYGFSSSPLLRLFSSKTQVFDPGEVLYVYESPAGYGLIILRLTGWIW